MKILWRQKGRQSRKLLWFSVAFFLVAAGFSLLAGVLDDVSDALWLTLAIFFGLSAALTYLLREDVFSQAAILLGAVLGCIWCFGYTATVYQPAVFLAGEADMLRVELTEYAESRTSYGLAYGVLTEVDGSVCHHKVRIYLKDGSPDYAPGDVLTFSGSIRRADPDYRAALLQRGCFLIVRQEEEEICERSGAMTLLRRARILSHDLGERSRKLLPDDEGALLAAMLCGDKHGMSRDLERALTVSGIRHITAVSGLHVSILAGMLIRLLGKKRGLLAAVPVAVIYAAIVGFPASVVRAVVFLAFWAASFWLKEERDPLTALGGALILLLLINPFSALSASLLLSFSATLGLIVLAPPISQALHAPLKRVKWKPLHGVLHYVVSTIAASAAAILFTFPVNMLFFDTVPLIGLLTNLVVLWTVAIAMELGIVLLALSFVSMPAAAFFGAYAVSWPLRWIVLAAKTAASWRFAATDAGNLYLALFGLVTVLILLLWKKHRLEGKTAVILAFTMLFTAAALTAGERLVLGEMEVFSSGGQPVILIRGERISLINTGAQSEPAAMALEEAMSRWNAAGTGTVLCTSSQYRTQGGLAAVLRNQTPERLLLPAKSREISESFSDKNPLIYRESGTVRINDLSVELLCADEDLYACRVVGPHVSLLDLCGVKPEQVRAVLEDRVCTADYLLLDDRLMNDSVILLYLVQAVQPDRILVADSGFRTYGKEYNGVPTVALGYDGVRIRYVR